MQRFLAGDISNGEGNQEQAYGFEQRCTEHRVEAVFPGRVGLQGYARDIHETSTVDPRVEAPDGSF